MELQWRRPDPHANGLQAKSNDTGITYRMEPTPMGVFAWELTITDPASSLTRPVVHRNNDAYTLYRIAQAEEDSACNER